MVCLGPNESAAQKLKALHFFWPQVHSTFRIKIFLQHNAGFVSAFEIVFIILTCRIEIIIIMSVVVLDPNNNVGIRHNCCFMIIDKSRLRSLHEGIQWVTLYKSTMTFVGCT